MKILSQIIERTSFYDICGYLFPGAMFWGLFYLLGYLPKCTVVKTLYFDYSTLFIPFLLLTSYFTGILFNDIEFFAETVISTIFHKFLSANLVTSESDINVPQSSTYTSATKSVSGENKELNAKELSDAIGKSIYKNLSIPDDKLIFGLVTRKKVFDYWPIIHAIVQTDERYTRVHIYRSMSLMRRGLVVGSFILFIYSDLHNTLFVTMIFFISTVMFMWRQWELERRTDIYEAVWFLDKVKSDCN